MKDIMVGYFIIQVKELIMVLLDWDHSVLEFSDRDILSNHRKLNDLNGSKKLNAKLIDVISNYVPPTSVLGHADLIKKEIIEFIKKNYPQKYFSMVFR